MDEFKFDPTKSLYIQIKDNIKALINTGQLKKGEKIPSERELCEMYGVSRITVRQALKEAIKEGLLFTVHGKGTFVKSEEPKIDQSLTRFTNFHSTITNKGLSAGTKILNYNVISIDFALCKILNLEISDQVFNLNLIGMADQSPYVLYKSYFEVSLGRRIYEQAKNKEKEKVAFSTFELYRQLGDVNQSFVDQSFEALSADDFMAKNLEIEKDSPLFMVTSIVYNQEKKPLEYREGYYRAGKYKFHIRRKLD